jgi:hypothetical protein
MSSNKQAITLVVMIFLLIILIYSSVAKFDTYAKPKITDIQCTKKSGPNPGGIFYDCCYWTLNSKGQADHYYCADCYKKPDGSYACGDYNQQFLPVENGTQLLPPGGHLNGNVTFSPSNSTTPPLPPTNTLQPSTGGLLNKAAPPPTFSAPIITGNPSNQQQSRQQLQAPPQQQQQTTTTCPDGSLPDANGNCPPRMTTNNQQLAPPSSSIPPEQQHHHKGSNLLGGQELTTKKDNNGNPSTSPPCPEGNEPIPPNCTLKPKF